MASCAPQSLSSASSVEIDSARTTCRPRAGSASGKVPELLCEAALKKLHEHLYSDGEGNRPRLSSVRFVCRHDRTSIYDSNGALQAQSVQIPALVRQAKASGVARYIGRGLNRWLNVHIADVAALYTLAIAKAPASTFMYVESG